MGAIETAMSVCSWPQRDLSGDGALCQEAAAILFVLCKN
jgi:hypothetical protein